MAYRGDTTDPLENMIQQRRVTNRWVIWGLSGYLGFSGFGGCSALSQMYLPAAPSAPSQSSPSQPSPSRSATPPSRAQELVTSDGKMSSFALERWLSTTVVSGPTPQDVRCRRALSGWDYICSYATPGPTPTRFKIGVLVSANSVLQASAPHKYESPLPSPSAAQ